MPPASVLARFRRAGVMTASERLDPRSRRPVRIDDHPDRAHAIKVGRSLCYRVGQVVVVNDAENDLFNLRADRGWL